MKEADCLKELLEGQTVVIITVKKVGSMEVEPMITIERVDESHIITNQGTYTGNKNSEIDYTDRSITIRDIGDNVVSRTFVVLNLNERKGRRYQPYPSTEIAGKWFAAEEASWNWKNFKTPT